MKNEKQNVINNKVILNLIQDLRRLPLSLINDRRGRFQIKFGMTALYNNGGFTLIELLVVVLIIGILAAVAVPQYQKVIAKNRIMVEFLTGKQIINAHEIYFLENGKHTDDVHKLDIEGLCTPVKNYTYICDTKNARIFVGLDTPTIQITNPSVKLEFSKTQVECQAKGADLNTLAHQACRAFTGQSTYSRALDWQNPPSYAYTMNL